MARQLFQGSDGKIVIWQRPNAALWTWLIAWVLSRVLPYGELNFVAALVAYGALFTWGWMELFQGVNLFRRLVGGVVLMFAVLSRLYLG